MPAPSASSTSATLRAKGVTHSLGGRLILDDVSVTVGPTTCLGVVGPNGAGKSTLLRIMAGLLSPDDGSVDRAPPGATIGYLAQEHERSAEDTVAEHLRRLTGVALAEEELETGSARSFPRAFRLPTTATPTHSSAGAGSVHRTSTPVWPRRLASSTWTRLCSPGPPPLCPGVRQLGPHWPPSCSRGSTCSSSTSRPTTSTSPASTAWRVRRRGARRRGRSSRHDRAFLDRPSPACSSSTSTPHRPGCTAAAGRPTSAERAAAAGHAEEAYAVYRRPAPTRSPTGPSESAQWATSGVARKAKQARDNDKAQRDFRINRTEKLAAKAARTERALDRLDVVDKPWEGWELRFGDRRRRRGPATWWPGSTDAVIERGAFRLGPLDLEIGWGERVALVGPNGTGKSTLLARPPRPAPAGLGRPLDRARASSSGELDQAGDAVGAGRR